jgi:magnesium transporter
LRKRTDGFLWIDIAEWSEEAEATLTNEFQFHPLAIAGSKTRSHVPRVHVYPDHVFIVVHAPEIGAAGHVHYLELDQFIGNDFLVTVHGPISPKVSLEAALRETKAVAARMESGRLLPISPFGLSYAIVSSIARRESHMVDEIAREVGLMEQRVMADVDEDPQKFLSELFAARHELLTIKTMAEQGGEIYRRAIKLTKFAPPEGLERMKDVLDQYESVAPYQCGPDAVSAGCHRVLSCAYRHEDDHRRRAARRDRGNHPTDYVAVIRHWHECHRQRFHAMDTVDHLVFDHASYLTDLAALDP